MVRIGYNYPLEIQLSEEDTDMYPRTVIFHSGSRVIDQSPKDLVHISSGMYTNNEFIPSTSGYYVLKYRTYSSNLYLGRSVNYGTCTEIIYVDSIEDNLVAVSSQSSEDNLVIDWISSQINPIHNDINWISSQSREIWHDTSYISSNIFWMSSQLLGISSQIEEEEYEFSKLESEVGYISSQVGYISSASEKYGYGGGKSYFIPEQRKSIWTQAQRDDLIKDVKETKNLIERLLKQLDKLQYKLKDTKNEKEVEKLTEDINLIGRMISSLMTDDELDKIKLEILDEN